MEALIKQENLERPVIVSPSMSGSFAIPYIMTGEPDTCQKRVHGYIPVAPAAASSFTESQYQKCKVITVILVYSLHH